MGDADIADVADFGAPASGESGGPAWSEGSDGRGAGGGMQQLRGDVASRGSFASRACCCGPLGGGSAHGILGCLGRQADLRAPLPRREGTHRGPVGGPQHLSLIHI
eukprot:14784376-Alexandrium_andersonii.AAC.1